MLLDWLFPSRVRHREIIRQLQILNMNLSALQAAAAGISTSIDAAVTALGSASADQAAIDSLTQQLTDAKTKLDAALNPPTP